MSVINQKEYLKKYLNIGKSLTGEKKKRKKKTKHGNCGLKIIDDNDDTFNSAVQEDLIGETEDAPQIVEVIDDRPPSLRIDEKSKSHLWIPIGGNPETLSFEDRSPPRRKVGEDVSPPRSKVDKYISPSRIKVEKDMSPKRRKIQEDISPPEIKVEKDMSPPRRKVDEDMSPPRRKVDEDMSPPRRKVDEDMSPPRRKVNEDMSPPRRKVDEDMSPPRKIRRDGDMSPPRRNRNTEDASSVVMNNKNNKEATSFTRNKNRLSKDSRWNSGNSNSSEIKTLDGKTAGLQNARDLVAETNEIRRREEKLFNSLSNEVLGANAPTTVRNRKIQNFAEAEKHLEMLEKKAESEEKYSRWGKGLKQVEDAAERRADALNEMSKPLARYADDEDLEKYLKAQEREGDPMLAYIRKKKKKQDIDEGKPTKPEYMGDFMPNRFGIRPGHRWDGVDRSNGYEKRWFEVQNSSAAERDESYKWNTEDM